MKIVPDKGSIVQVEVPAHGNVVIWIMKASGDIVAAIQVVDGYEIKVTNPDGKGDITVEK
jgi:hypothetical protein